MAHFEPKIKNIWRGAQKRGTLPRPLLCGRAGTPFPTFHGASGPQRLELCPRAGAAPSHNPKYAVSVGILSYMYTAYRVHWTRPIKRVFVQRIHSLVFTELLGSLRCRQEEIS